MARKIETLFLNGPDGQLEARLEEPENRDPIEAALVCHPHPQHGGTMLNKVVHRVALGLRRSGCVVLRFNYRGVNLSEGKYDDGVGEVEDARAALSFLLSRYPTLPVTLAGFSFGSRIALKLGCELGYPRRVIAVGFPTVYKDRSYLEGCTLPRVFIQSTHDEFGPMADLAPLVAALPDPKKLIAIQASDHFFVDALPELENAVASC